MSRRLSFEKQNLLLTGITIDTSRAKSNAQTVSICAQKLQMIEVFFLTLNYF